MKEVIQIVGMVAVAWVLLFGVVGGVVLIADRRRWSETASAWLVLFAAWVLALLLTLAVVRALEIEDRAEEARGQAARAAWEDANAYDFTR